MDGAPRRDALPTGGAEMIGLAVASAFSAAGVPVGVVGRESRRLRGPPRPEAVTGQAVAVDGRETVA